MLCCFKFLSYSETETVLLRACVYSVLSFQLLLSLLLLRTPHTPIALHVTSQRGVIGPSCCYHVAQILFTYIVIGSFSHL